MPDKLLAGFPLQGNSNMGFKRTRVGLLLQSLIAGALDDGNYIALASLDLSAAYKCS